MFSLENPELLTSAKMDEHRRRNKFTQNYFLSKLFINIKKRLLVSRGIKLMSKMEFMKGINIIIWTRNNTY